MSRKNALVTGGSRGIGASICKALARSGYFTYINYQKGDYAQQLLAEIQSEGGDGEIIKLDVSSPQNIQNGLVNSGLRDTHLDLLVNNAGILRDNLVTNTTEEDWNAVLNVNFLGMVECFRACFPLLQRSGGAKVINMGSISGTHGGKGQGSYATSKALVIEWTRQMSRKLKQEGIKFYAISPGPVATEMIKQSPFYQQPNAKRMIPVNRLAEPDEIGNLVVHLALSQGEVLNGYNWVADGGFTLSPKS